VHAVIPDGDIEMRRITALYFLSFSPIMGERVAGAFGNKGGK
jgi:hypothetical protein